MDKLESKLKYIAKAMVQSSSMMFEMGEIELGNDLLTHALRLVVVLDLCGEVGNLEPLDKWIDESIELGDKCEKVMDEYCC